MDAKVTAVEKQNEHFVLTTEHGPYEAIHVILATGALTDLAEASGVITIPGTEPRIKKVVKTDASGKTSVAGIWAAGTCAGVSVHTIITSGDGAKVAVNVISDLNGERYVDHDVIMCNIFNVLLQNGVTSKFFAFFTAISLSKNYADSPPCVTFLLPINMHKGLTGNSPEALLFIYLRYSLHATHKSIGYCTLWRPFPSVYDFYGLCIIGCHSI